VPTKNVCYLVCARDLPNPAVCARDLPNPAVCARDLPNPAVCARDLPNPAVCARDLPNPAVCARDLPNPAIYDIFTNGKKLLVILLYMWGLLGVSLLNGVPIL